MGEGEPALDGGRQRTGGRWLLGSLRVPRANVDEDLRGCDPPTLGANCCCDGAVCGLRARSRWIPAGDGEVPPLLAGSRLVMGEGPPLDAAGEGEASGQSDGGGGRRGARPRAD
nr:unnamed protein product [Digitaria exilis]